MLSKKVCQQRRNCKCCPMSLFIVRSMWLTCLLFSIERHANNFHNLTQNSDHPYLAQLQPPPGWWALILQKWRSAPTACSCHWHYKHQYFWKSPYEWKMNWYIDYQCLLSLYWLSLNWLSICLIAVSSTPTRPHWWWALILYLGGPTLLLPAAADMDTRYIYKTRNTKYKVHWWWA